jgi:hypothetical protein
MRAPVVFLLGALEAQAITMTVSVPVAWPGPGRRGKHKCGGGREKEYVSHSQPSGGYLFTVPFPEMVTEMIDRSHTPVCVGWVERIRRAPLLRIVSNTRTESC